MPLSRRISALFAPSWLHALAASAALLGCHEHGDPGEDRPVADVSAGGDTAGTPGDTAQPSPDTSRDTTGGELTCTSDADCADSLDCSVDSCESGICRHAPKPGTCLVSATCFEDGDPGPLPCRVCDSARSSTELSPADGTCDDGDICTTNDSCSGGACVGGPPPDCDDGVFCTDDACAPEAGCVHVPSEAPCDDGDGCTADDTCLLAFCVGAPRDCDDHNPCTADTCTDGACVHTSDAQEGQACDDGDACTEGTVCTDATCVGGTPVTCDDGNACTVDYCDTFAGCGALPTESPCCLGSSSICDDGNDCTLDSCDPVTTDCSHTATDAAACDDGDPCTTGEACTGSACEGGEANTCDDNNVCTTDACLPGVGCKHFPAEGSCDDGLACSTGDVCFQGVCKADTTACGCIVPPGVDANKVATLQISTDAKPGTALDLDGDPATCAPSGSCSGGVHNSFSVLAGLANSALVSALSGGDIVLLVTAPQNADGDFDLVLYQGDLDPSNAACDLSTATCEYTVGKSSFDAACQPRFVLPATLDGDTLTAGSITSQIPFSIPIQGITLEVVVYAARLEGSVVRSGGNIVSFSGVLGGAISQAALLTAIDNLPDQGLPVPKDLIKTILQTSLEFDIDTDGDQKGDAASIALQLTGIDATLTGVVD